MVPNAFAILAHSFLINGLVLSAKFPIFLFFFNFWTPNDMLHCTATQVMINQGELWLFYKFRSVHETGLAENCVAIYTHHLEGRQGNQ